MPRTLALSRTGAVITAPVRDEASPDERIRRGLRQLREELALPREFPDEVLAAAELAAHAGGLAGDAAAGRRRRDLTGIDFVTIDPPGSTDLDQAVHIERRGQGFRVRYAIADVAAFVGVGGPLDDECRARGVTIYLPDGRIPLHPPVLSEHAASLRAGEDRPALVWQLDLDADGSVDEVVLERAVVRSRAELDYPSLQRSLDDGDPASRPEVATLLAEVGRLRQDRAAERGAVSLPLPDQEVVIGADGHIGLTFRAPLPVEDWNAQISLMTGMAAARIMVDDGVGVLRTLPPPDGHTVAELRADAAALGVDWGPEDSYADVIRSLDPAFPDQAAFATQAARLLRGSGYAAFDRRAGIAPPEGSDAEHSALAAPYAHVTAPLRRLVDRFANEVVLACCAGAEVADDVRAALAVLPELMASARRRESQADSGARDLVEQVILSGHVGQPLDAVVVGVDRHGLRLQVRDPAVLGRVDTATAASFHLGQEVVVTADDAGSLELSAPPSDRHADGREVEA